MSLSMVILPIRCIPISKTLFSDKFSTYFFALLLSVGIGPSIRKHGLFLNRRVMSGLWHGMVLCVVICWFHGGVK